MMPDLSTFLSRKGSLTCTPPEIFDFVTDIRNFRQFVPQGIIDDLRIEAESCSFDIPPLGKVNLNLDIKEPNKKVVFRGNVMSSNDFSMVMDIVENIAGRAEVSLGLDARMNPILKMMAARPIEDFLEKLIEEMEKFRAWRPDNRFPEPENHS
jgi:carbon monoxide dehydrogenase subunit G